MILRKDKWNRKRKSKEGKEEESSDGNNKYVAYVRKTNNSNTSTNKLLQPSCSFTAGSTESLSVMKKRKKRKLDRGTVINKAESLVNVATVASKTNINVSICAKPKINKAALKLNAAIRTKGKVYKCPPKGKIIKSSLKHTKQKLKIENWSNISNVEMIMPLVSLVPDVMDDEPSKNKAHVQFQLPDSDLSSLNIDHSESESTPIIIEANLKKSSSSYIPKALKDKEFIKKKETVVNKLKPNNNVNKKSEFTTSLKGNTTNLNCETIKAVQNHKEVTSKDGTILVKLHKTDETTKKTSESNLRTTESNLEPNTSTGDVQDLKSEVPSALQNFYNEVTKIFDNLVKKSTNNDRKAKKMIEKLSKSTSCVSSDKPINDSITPVDIVSKNTTPLENLSLSNQENDQIQDSNLSSLNVDHSESESTPIIIEATLKKSSSSYVPKALKDQEFIKKKETVVNKLKTDNGNKKSEYMLTVNKSTLNSSTSVKDNAANSDSETIKALQDHKEITNEGGTIIVKLHNTDETLKKKSESNLKANESIVDSNNLTDSVQDLNSDIPKALQHFYNEVTRGFDNNADKSSKNKKKIKNKSALSVDKSVKDSNSLVDIVSKNTVLLENSSLSNQENVAQFFSLESKVILVLWPETQFSFSGKLKLQVLYGAVELYGSVFNPQNTVKPIKVYSPRGYSSISISTAKLGGTYDKEALWDALTTEGVDRSLKTKLHDIISECKEGWSVLLLENFENTLTNFLKNHCSFKLFPKVENYKYSWCDPKRAECVLQANFLFCSAKDEIKICPQWNRNVTNQLLDRWNSSKSLCTLIAGGKGVGKSTTARYLINSLLKHSKKIILLDLDPGQAELTPAGCVSLNVLDKPLLGPNFSHLKTPFYQLYLEDVNVSNCITRYIECIKRLVECLKSRKDLTQYPLIVNTMGFCKGIGLDICIFLIKLIQPSNVVQLISRKPRNNFDFALVKQTINSRKSSSISCDNDNMIYQSTCEYVLHYVPSMAEGKRQFDSWNMEPRQQRELVLLSYLSQIIKNADEKCYCNFTSNRINNIIPYKLPFSAFYVTLIKSSISPTHILAAMNGNIVALCGIDLDDDTSTEDRESLNYPLVVIKPPPSTCYGYGVVRGIDMKSRCVYVNTPLAEPQLRHVNLLAGCSAVPFSLLHSDELSNQPYSADRDELPTSREPRRGYFRVDQSKNG